MGQTATRCLVEAYALGRLRPCGRIPLLGVGDLRIAGLDVRDELVEEELVDLRIQLAVEATGSRAADHRRQPDLRCEVQHLRDRIDLVEHHLLSPGRLAEQALLCLRVDDDVAGQRTDLSQLAMPFRRLQPGVLALLVELLPLRTRTRLRARVVRLRLAIPRMQFVAVALLIRIPGVLDALSEHGRIRHVVAVDFRELRIGHALTEVLNHTVAADEQILEEVAVARAGERLDGIGTIGENALLRHAAAIDAAGLDIGRTNGQQVGDIVVIDQRAAQVDGTIHDVEAGRVDRRIAIVQRDGARHTADNIMRMRVLATEDDVRRHELALLVEHLEVMRHGHEVYLRRQELVVGVIPPVRREDAQLAALDDSLDLALNLSKVLRRCRRECMVVSLGGGHIRRAERQLVGVQHRVLQVRRGHRISRERLDRGYPVQRMQMIEMHDMILHRQRCRHDVADIVRVFRNRDAEGILDRTQGSQGMRRRADAADTLDIGPGVTRVTVLHDELEAAPGRARGYCIAYFAALVDRRLYAEMTFDTSDRIYYDMLCHLFFT